MLFSAIQTIKDFLHLLLMMPHMIIHEDQHLVHRHSTRKGMRKAR
jgi:hypothetical protein